LGSSGKWWEGVRNGELVRNSFAIRNFILYISIRDASFISDGDGNTQRSSITPRPKLLNDAYYQHMVDGYCTFLQSIFTQ